MGPFVYAGPVFDATLRVRATRYTTDDPGTLHEQGLRVATVACRRVPTNQPIWRT